MSATATINTESKDEPFVQARWCSKQDRRTVNLHVVHDMEAPEGPSTAENCARDFANRGPENPGSAHKVIDTDSVVRCVHDKDMAAAAPGSNSNGLHYELCGYARQTPAEWADEASVATMRLAAREIADDMHRYNNRPVFRTAGDLKAGLLDGWTTHAQVSLAFHRTTHTDPGGGFPLAWFGQLINDFYNGIDPGDDDMSAAGERTLIEGVSAMRKWMVDNQAKLNVLDKLGDEVLGEDPNQPADNTRLALTRRMLIEGPERLERIEDTLDKLVEKLAPELAKK